MAGILTPAQHQIHPFPINGSFINEYAQSEVNRKLLILILKPSENPQSNLHLETFQHSIERTYLSTPSRLASARCPILPSSLRCEYSDDDLERGLCIHFKVVKNLCVSPASLHRPISR